MRSRDAKRPPDHEPDRYGRVEMAARNGPDCVGHRQHGKAECYGDARQADSDAWEGRRKNRAAAPAEDEQERSQEFSCQFFLHVSFRSLDCS
jgi:hypothetical protein